MTLPSSPRGARSNKKYDERNLVGFWRQCEMGEG